MFHNVSFFAAGLIFFMIGVMRLSALVRVFFTSRIREYIRYAVRKPVYGVVTGVVATVFFQSSTTTTVLTVGMVSAGLISFYHSIGIILGADMGTTFTVQLVVWKVTEVSPLFVVVGGLLWLTPADKVRRAGEAVFYFGLMLFGLNLTGTAVAPLRNNAAFLGFFQHVKNPLWGLALGAGFTALVHASAIPISMLVVLAQQNLITTGVALPILFGANMGTTVTALIASIVGNVNGRRTAASHLLFKSTGAVVCLAALPLFTLVLKRLSASTAQQIALGHLLFNLLIALFFIFLVKPVSSLIEVLLPGEGETLPVWPIYLNDKYLSRPDAALDCVQRELERQLVVASAMCRDAIRLFSTFSRGKSRDIGYMESVTDNLRGEIVDYLCRMSERELPAPLSARLFAYTALADDIERIGDHAVVLRDLREEMRRRKTGFTAGGKAEMEEIARLVEGNLADSISLIEKGDQARIREISRREEMVDQKVMEAREKHVVRLHRRICEPEAAPIFLETLLNLERISDHCQNIAEYMTLPGEVA
ncbi:MAG: Na/Pi cotransporter family protein [Syntrophorhabdales bacterium]|jgi:phosphate:Na+ symporter